MVLVELILFVLTASPRQVDATCELCFDGETITKPDYVLGLTDPVRIQTCEHLVDLLVFIQEDDDLCSVARSVSTLCGCPNRPPNACTICGENMTRPHQNLAGLVDLGGVDYFGLASTCALLESGINNIDKDEQECSTLPIDELQLYCGCRSGEEENNSASTTCTLCPGEEIVPADPQNSFRVIHLNSNGDRISCSDAQQQVLDLERGSVLCDDIQRGSTNCGCPVPENACELCPDGTSEDLTKKSLQIDTLFGVRQDCGTFRHQVRRLDRDSVECQSIHDSIIEACCSTLEVEFVPCTLCPGGESVAYPDKMIVGMDGVGYDYLEPRCGVLDEAAKFNDANDVACFTARTLAKVCGCAMPETSCSMCEAAGDTLSNPHGEYQWAFGNLQESFPEIHESIDIERRFRCEVADSFLSAVYDNGDDFCYFNQLIRGTACGCHGSQSSRVIALVWSQRCSGLLSLFGSVLIIVFVLTKQTKNRWNTFNQLVLSISVFDALSSIAYIFGTALTPAYLGLYGSIGTERTCVFQGWLFQMGITSVYYNVALCFYFLVVVKFNWTERKFKKVRKWIHLGILAIGITMSLAVIPFVTAGWRWCYLNKPPYYESWLPGVFFFILPIGICMIGMTILLAFFVKYVHLVERKSNKWKLSGNTPKRRSLASRTFWQSFYFLAVFYMVWPIQFVAFIIPLAESSYWVYLLAAVLGPLQGFLNAMVVFYRDWGQARKQILRLLGINCIKERWSVALSRWSSVFGVDSSAILDPKLSLEKISSSAKMESEVPAAEHSTSLDEEKPVDIGVEEDPTLSNVHEYDDALMDSGIVHQQLDADVHDEASLGCDAGIDTSPGVDAVCSGENSKRSIRSSIAHESDAMLELAMNAGLLNDDDYALYQDSIHRIIVANS